MQAAQTTSAAVSMPAAPSAQPQPSAPSYTLPPSDTKSLIQELRAERAEDGAVIFSGRILLPRESKIWIGPKPGEDKRVTVGDNGEFRTTEAMNGAEPYPAGRRPVRVFAHFDGAWQPLSVLSLVGMKGSRLPKRALRPDDPEFPEEGRHLEEDRLVNIPPLSEQARKALLQAKSREEAIRLVKGAKLYVKGEGQAIDTVGYIVAWYADAGRRMRGFSIGDWTADPGDGNEWIVTLTFYDTQDTSAGKRSLTNTARWAADLKSRKVRYLDANAKNFSYLVPY